MKFTEDEKRYLDKLRRNYPKRDIPTDEVVKNALSKMKRDGSEVVIDDLIIRTWDGIIEMEMI
jgi:hypothetical protein